MAHDLRFEWSEETLHFFIYLLGLFLPSIPNELAVTDG